MERKHILFWGIHNGTITSKDEGKPYEFDTEKECLDKVKELRIHFATMGYRIWFANILYPNGETKSVEFNSYL